MKLNLGSSTPRGQYRDTDWICLDLDPKLKVDVVGSGLSLPFKDNSFNEIHSIHVLEHLTRDKWPIVLSEIFRVLDLGGTFFLEVPDFEEQCRKYLKRIEQGDIELLHLIRTGIWGKTERFGMAHYFGFDKELLKRALNKIGFSKVERLINKDCMISTHYRYDPVLLFKSFKESNSLKIDIKNLSFEELNKCFLR